MKRTILSLALLVIALATNAQTIKTNFKKGDVRKYITAQDYSIGIPMRGEMKGSATIYSTYTVTDASKGWTVEMKVDSFSTTGNEDIINQFSNAANYKALQKTPVILKLDAKGYISDIQNSDDVLAAVAEVSINDINNLYSKHPEIENVVPKSKAMLKVNDELTKDNLLKFVREYSLLSLNGKEIKQGEPVDEDLLDLIKVKSTYSVSKNTDGLTVISKSSESNMSEDDIKAMLKQQISKMGGGVDASQIDQMWGQLKMMGMTRLDLTNQTSSTFNADGWLKSDTVNSTTSVMGAQIKITSNTSLK